MFCSWSPSTIQNHFFPEPMMNWIILVPILPLPWRNQDAACFLGSSQLLPIQKTKAHVDSSSQVLLHWLFSDLTLNLNLLAFISGRSVYRGLGQGRCYFWVQTRCWYKCPCIRFWKPSVCGVLSKLHQDTLVKKKRPFFFFQH